MHKSKKKSAKIPKPIKVKKEEDRTPQPMSHYVDDRLELVKQIFGSLKPKTITNLAPDFLKENELEEIQELCLNELLGISKKRLLSIINATKCPSDTDSSDDSDVHNIEEHVSLEEISSDSEIEGGAVKSSKKKSSGVAAKGGSKKDGSKNVSEKNENSGQISVLELLELQARARAIRSQLALEPVTKIEVDDDCETDEISSTKSKESQNSSNRKERKRKSNDQADTTKISKSNGIAAPKVIPDKDSLEKQQPSVASSKKIKLKRNFRTNTDTAAKTTQSEKKAEVTPNPKAAISQNEIKEEKRSRSRSASPDVIPIVTETVTLMISDSSDEDKVLSAKAKPTKKPTIVVTSVEVIKPTLETNIAQTNKSSPAEITDSSSDTTKQAEDGEVLDETVFSHSKNKDTAPAEENTNDAKIVIKQKECLNKACNEDAEKSNTEQNRQIPQIVTSELSFKANEPTTTERIENNKTTSKSNGEQEVTHLNAVKIAETPIVSRAVDEDDDDQNDDVISIEGGDLETEMTEHLVDDNKKQSFCATSPEKKERSASPEGTSEKEGKPPNETKASHDDVISLGSSDDELTKASQESWNTRWLKSSKVSKVLATSKLGKRVRDKIKKTKRSKKDSLREDKEVDDKKSSSNSTYTSKHEVGSIEQYKELLEIQRQQRKD